MRRLFYFPGTSAAHVTQLLVIPASCYLAREIYFFADLFHKWRGGCSPNSAKKLRQNDFRKGGLGEKSAE